MAQTALLKETVSEPKTPLPDSDCHAVRHIRIQGSWSLHVFDGIFGDDDQIVRFSGTTFLKQTETISASAPAANGYPTAWQEFDFTLSFLNNSNHSSFMEDAQPTDKYQIWVGYGFQHRDLKTKNDSERGGWKERDDQI